MKTKDDARHSKPNYDQRLTCVFLRKKGAKFNYFNSFSKYVGIYEYV